MNFLHTANNMSDNHSIPPLTQPVGLFPHLVARRQELLIMKGGWSGGFKISLFDGTPLLEVEAEQMSLSHRKHIVDVASQKRLCTIRKETWSFSWRYYGVENDSDDNAPHVFDIESHAKLLSGTENIMRFRNMAVGGEEVQIEFKNNPWGKEGAVMLDGVPVAIIERKGMQIKMEYHLHVAQGLDMSLIVAVFMAQMDRSRSSGAAAGAAAGAASAS